MDLPQKIDGTNWDWEYAEANNHPERVAFFRENWKKPVTLEEYVNFEMTRSHTKNKPPSKRKKQAIKDYHHLRNKWGFFRTPTNFLD